MAPRLPNAVPCCFSLLFPDFPLLTHPMNQPLSADATSAASCTAAPSPLPEAQAQGLIDQLWVYPVKSCAGVALQQATLTDTGLALDRAWMVVDAHDQFVTQREHPRMVLIQPDIRTAVLVLRAPGQPDLSLDPTPPGPTRTVRVWKDSVPAWDMGDTAARWFSAFLGQPGLRLVRFDAAHRRLSSLDWTHGVEAPNAFSDGYPLLLTTDTALDLLNQHLQAQGHGAVTLARMRANVVVSGLPAHDEDHWVQLRCVATEPGGESVHLQVVKPCARCPIPNIDPDTAESTPHVSDALQSYRQDPRLNGALTFGMNAIVRQGVGQTLRVGQRVFVDYGLDPV
jgi:uncharacterized protein